MNPSRKKIWRHEHVVDAEGPAFALRTYLEQSDIRRWLARVSSETTIVRACDVGAGYGRLTPVLAEFAPQVVAFEREAHFVADMRRLLPQVDAQQIEHLWQLPAADRSFQFVLSFTVLQHLTEHELGPVVDELKRIVAPASYVLLCEATDTSFRYDEHYSPEGGVTVGRSVEQYQVAFAPFELVAVSPRRMEPSYPLHTGTYMLFKQT